MTDYFVSHPPNSHLITQEEKKRKEKLLENGNSFFSPSFSFWKGGVIRNICRKRWRLGKVRFREVIGEATFLGAHFAIDITNLRAPVDETTFPPPSSCGSEGRGRGGGRRGKKRNRIIRIVGPGLAWSRIFSLSLWSSQCCRSRLWRFPVSDLH